MLMGKSLFHKAQSEGSFYEKGKLRGYYSDLRHKVTGGILVDEKHNIPVNITDKGARIFFPIAIFQYGLGAYDLYLETSDNIYMEKFGNSVKWALDNQNENGSWDTFDWLLPDAKYSSMAQAEGTSLLCRAYSEWQDIIYLNAARRAIDFMLIPVEKGGTTCYGDSGVMTFEERVGRRTILNGMVFSIWGLYDLTLLVDDSYYKDMLDQSVEHLCRILPDYDRRFWSDYDLGGNIASKFYHMLHIEQLRVLYNLFDKNAFLKYIDIWSKYSRSFFCPKQAFIIKAIQKMRVINTESAIVK